MPDVGSEYTHKYMYECYACKYSLCRGDCEYEQLECEIEHVKSVGEHV